MWVAKPPAGTYFTRGRLVARGRRGNGYRPRLLLGAPRRGASESIGSLGRGFRVFRWRARSRADRLIAELTCARRTTRCRRAQKPKIYVKRARFHLIDASPPAVRRLGGALLDGPVQRATQALRLNARDAGSGVRSVAVRTNRRLFDTVGSNCNIGADQLALGLSPCPNSVQNSVFINTLMPGFHEGQNSIEVCVNDYAEASPNERCAKRRIRVDNDCPISERYPDAPRSLCLRGRQDGEAVEIRPAPPGGRQVHAALGRARAGRLGLRLSAGGAPELDGEAGRPSASYERPRKDLGAASRRPLTDRLPDLLAWGGAGSHPGHPPAFEAEAGASGAPAGEASQRAENDLARPAARAIPHKSSGPVSGQASRRALGALLDRLRQTDRSRRRGAGLTHIPPRFRYAEVPFQGEGRAPGRLPLPCRALARAEEGRDGRLRVGASRGVRLQAGVARSGDGARAYCRPDPRRRLGDTHRCRSSPP